MPNKNTPTDLPDYETRRARRAAARAARATPAGRKLQYHRPWWKSNVVRLTGGALIVGLALVAFMLISSPKVGAAPLPPTQTTPIANASGNGGRSLGPASAPVKVDLWADFQCPACELFTQTVELPLIHKYVSVANPQVQITFHDMSFLGQESIDAAVAARCAGAQGRADFWAYHDWLYANQGLSENSGAFNQARLKAIAAAMGGLDSGTFASCLSDPATLAAVTTEKAAGVAKGVNSTPTILINGTNVADHSLAGLSAAIDPLLPKPSPTAPTSPSSPVSPAAQATPSATAIPTATATVSPKP